MLLKVIVLCSCLYVVVCNVEDRTMISENPNIMPIRMPNINDIGWGDRMSMSVPMMKSQPTYIRPIPPPMAVDGPVNGMIMPNAPGSYFSYEMYKNYPQQRHVCVPKLGYAPPDNMCPTGKMNNMDSNRVLQIQVPPGLPPKTITKLDKLVNTINRSLVTLCQKDDDEDCAMNGREYIDKNAEPSGNRNEKRWAINDKFQVLSNEGKNVEQGYEQFSDKQDDRLQKRSVCDEALQLERSYSTLLEGLLH